jgi:hypothetical protein
MVTTPKKALTRQIRQQLKTNYCHARVAATSALNILYHLTHAKPRLRPAILKQIAKSFLLMIV